MSLSAPRLLAFAGATLALACLALEAPLLVYTASLALFGVPHALVEFRYVDRRYGRGLPVRAAVTLGILLLAIAFLRGLGVAGQAGPLPLGPVELLLVGGLLVAVLPVVRDARPAASVLSVVLLAAVLAGALAAPALALLAFAWLHNLTPIGFIADAVPAGRRRPLLGALALAFVLVPLLIVSGWLGTGGTGFMTRLGWPGSGALDDHLGAFLSGSAREAAWAGRAFAAAAYLQVLHHAAVLLVLPRLLPPNSGGRLPWPQRRRFHAAVLALGLLAAIGFAWSFGRTRGIYGMLAAVHAWVELPVLLGVLARRFPRATQVEAADAAPALHCAIR